MNTMEGKLEVAVHSMWGEVEKRRWPAKKRRRHIWSARSQPKRRWNPERSIGRYPKQHAAVKTFGASMKKNGEKHLAVGRRGQPEVNTRGNCGSRKKLVAAGKKMTRRF
jgi:hypothetical protein